MAHEAGISRASVQHLWAASAIKPSVAHLQAVQGQAVTSGKAATRRRSRWCGGSASPIRPLRRRLAENPSPYTHRAASNGSVSRPSERGGSQRQAKTGSPRAA
jgi:hypothetical protein